MWSWSWVRMKFVNWLYRQVLPVLQEVFRQRMILFTVEFQIMLVIINKHFSSMDKI